MVASLLAAGGGISQGLATATGYVTGHDARMLAVAGIALLASAFTFFSTAGVEATKKFL
jgi:hypothetical protein